MLSPQWSCHWWSFLESARISPKFKLSTWLPSENTYNKFNCAVEFSPLDSLQSPPLTIQLPPLWRLLLNFYRRSHEQDRNRFNCRFRASFLSLLILPLLSLYYLLNQTLLKSGKKRILSDCRGNYIILWIPFDVFSCLEAPNFLSRNFRLVSIEMRRFRYRIIRSHFKGWRRLKGWGPLGGDLRALWDGDEST